MTAMQYDDETIMAYADGELDAALRARIADAVARDPVLADRVARHQALRGALGRAYDGVLAEPVPERLRAALASSGNVIPLQRARDSAGGRSAASAARSANWSWPQWGAIAASLLVGFLVAQRLPRGAGPALSAQLVGTSQGIYAAGALANALGGQLASAQAANDPVQIGISYRSKAGDYCRSFVSRAEPASPVAGLACRNDSRWRVRTLADAPAANIPDGGTGYRQAATALPPAVLASVEDSIDGMPLDAAGEAAALRAGWNATPH